jgi:DNA polymerase I-like protein with 3'-5' exonuclease and polymerase domains
LYGAGDVKLGSIVAPTSSEAVQAKKGKALRAKFYKNIPALQRLTEDVQASAKSRGFLFGVDGRKLNIRSQHAALNTLLQSAGAIMMKLATVIFHWEMAKNGYTIGHDYTQVIHCHDEYQINSKACNNIDNIGEIAVRAIELAGLHFGFPCPTTGEYKTGSNWADTH